MGNLVDCGKVIFSYPEFKTLALPSPVAQTHEGSQELDWGHG